MINHASPDGWLSIPTIWQGCEWCVDLISGHGILNTSSPLPILAVFRQPTAGDALLTFVIPGDRRHCANTAWTKTAHGHLFVSGGNNLQRLCGPESAAHSMSMIAYPGLGNEVRLIRDEVRVLRIFEVASALTLYRSVLDGDLAIGRIVTGPRRVWLGDTTATAR